MPTSPTPQSLPRDPAHACIGTELIDHKRGVLWRLQHDGWRNVGKDQHYPERDVTTPVPATRPFHVSHAVYSAWCARRDVRRRVDRATRLDESFMHRSINEIDTLLHKRPALIVPEERLFADVKTLLNTWAAVMVSGNWQEDDGVMYRRAWGAVERTLAMYYDIRLHHLMEIASNDIHGACSLSFDGDCFEPPEWTAYVHGWPFIVHAGGGDTAAEAVRRALHLRDAYEIAQRAKNTDPNDTPPEGFGDLSSDVPKE